MAKYKVVGRYSATFDGGGGRVRVVLTPGSTVELEDAVAEFVARDAPGVLEAAPPAKPKPKRGRPRGAASNRDTDEG